MLPLVSIIIPVYNSEKYIAETICSAKNQTWPNKEIIIVDDGSTDQSLSIAKNYKNEWIKIFHQENKGASSARNYGLREAKGNYIQFLDSDDLLSPNKVEVQLKMIKGKKAALSICPTIHFFDGENPRMNLPSPYELGFLNATSNTTAFLIKLYGGEDGYSGMIAVHSWLTPRYLIDKIGPWDEEITVDDDGEYFSRIILLAEEITVTKNVFNYYRKYKQSNSLSVKKSEQSYKSILEAALLKKKNLLSYCNSVEAKIAIYKMLTDVCIETYIEYPHLYRKSKSERPRIQYPYKFIIGGRTTTKIISKLMGWRCAKMFQLLLKKLNLNLHIKRK